MNKIPKGWELKKLGEIFNVIGGGTPNTNNAEFWSGNISWISSADIDKENFNAIPRKFITENAIQNSATNLVPKNTIIVVTRVGLGKVAITKEPMCFSQDSQALIPFEKINVKFMAYQIKQIAQNFINISRGTTINGITKQNLKDCKICVPPLSEQKAIADKLDDSFAKIENAITNLINAKENLKLYKQSVLKSAFNGDLLPNTSPTHWEVKKLGEICEITMGQSPKGENVFENSQSLNGLEFHQGKICFTDKFISKSKFITSDIRKIAEVGSILLCVRAPVGVINLTERKIAIGRGLCALKANNQNNNFLYYYLLGLKQYFESKATGSTFSAITLNIVKNCEIPLPPLSEQNLIVTEIDRRFAIVDKTLNLIDKSIQNAKNLKQSILKKAFSGELRSEI
ncbi:restriction endonuclease subunit S [uncultured Campylobacter sp.]|uniref:restriction endonuclease subunit S n=1 Tax=uncultured Campylobacter sp. TaxID=218934 RepID=UPI0025D590A3|nr:restriction endonuclease subunit S [uncultured Campylobacter sp.]